MGDGSSLFPPPAQVGEVILVYDGKPGEAASTGGEDPTVVITAGGDEGSGVPRVSADDWILDAISREDRRPFILQSVTVFTNPYRGA